MDDRDIYSHDNSDDRDIFSYDNSNNEVDEGQASFDLNSFSSIPSGDTEEMDNKSKKSKKNKSNGRKPKKERNVKRFILQWVLAGFLICIITAALVVGGIFIYAFSIDSSIDIDLTNPEGLDFTTTVYIQDEDGKWVEYKNLHGEYNCIWVEYDEKASISGDKSYKGIPANLANAFVAIEDKGFKDHYGVDWKRTFGAVLNEVFHFSSKFGGSTITQQLVKNLTGDREQDAGRKMREIMRARELETKYSKEVILECYLNRVPLGGSNYGVQAAAKDYFGKDVSELTIAECACLASITKAPSYYSPDKNPENNKERRLTVLREMYNQGYITKKEYEEAKKEEIKLVNTGEDAQNGEVNSYFVDALLDQVINDLCDKYGYTRKTASDMIYKSGYKIYATVDPEIQAIVEEEYIELASKAQKSSEGKPLWGAMTVMDYEGNVRAIVGGIGEKTTNRGFNCATDAKRQPGSTMKPLAVYSLALERGNITYSTMLNDTKIKFGNWSPKNAGGGYSGNITANYALKVSKNTIPVILANQLGVEDCFTFVTEKLGLTNLNEKEDKNLSSMGLGGTNGGVTTLESAAAYAIFGNGGKYYKPSFYTKVTDQNGNIVLEKSNKPTSTPISGDTAYIMNKMLQNVIYGSGGTGNGVKSAVKNMKLFGKTGTSSENKDKWFVGGSPYYVVSSWCGYENMTEELPRANLNIAKDQWAAVMKRIHKGLKAKEYPKNQYVLERYYCEETGGLATAECKKTTLGWYKGGVSPKLPETCPKHSGTVLGTPEEEKKKQEEEKKKQEEEKKKQEEEKKKQEEANKNQSATSSGTSENSSMQSNISNTPSQETPSQITSSQGTSTGG